MNKFLSIRLTRSLPLLAVLTAGAAPSAAASAAEREIVINEIFYHPPDDLDRLQFVELHNRGPAAVDLSGWSFARGIQFQFPEGQRMEPGSYLVICRDREAFAAKYGREAAAAGDFTGKLSQGKEMLELVDRDKKPVDAVRYSDGAEWPEAPDGYGASLERISPSADSSLAANWTASRWARGGGPRGTPGKVNDGFSERLPPSIDAVEFSPKCPKPGQAVTVTARIASAAGIQEAALLFRLVGAGKEPPEPPPDTTVPMQPVSGQAGAFRAVIDGQPDMQLVRFRIAATAADGARRIAPSPGELQPTFSYFVYANAEKTTVPQGFIFQASRGEGPPRRRGFFEGLFSGRDAARPSGPPPGASAFIYIPAAGAASGDAAAAGAATAGAAAAGAATAGAATAGAATAGAAAGATAETAAGAAAGADYRTFDHVAITPRKGGYKVRFNNRRPLQGMSTINLIFESSPRYLLSEPLAYELYRMAGVAAELTDHVRLWIEGRPIGYHLLVEQPNKSFLRRNKRSDSGHLYKLIWYGNGFVGQHEKKTRIADGHEGLVALRDGLASKSGEEQWEFIQKQFNVDEVAGYYAVNMCLSNWDGFFNNYFIYQDAGGTGKWEIYPWDEDKTWGDFDGAVLPYAFCEMPITFGMAGDRPPARSSLPRTSRGFGPLFGGASAPGWWRPPGYFSGPLLANPGFRRVFLKRLKEICSTIFTPEKFGPAIDALEKRLEPEIAYWAELNRQAKDQALAEFHANIDSFRTQIAQRRKFLLAQEELREP